MKYIVISGIDGSGKTTIINELQKKLHQRGDRACYIWMRYNHYLVKMLNALARILTLSVKTSYGNKTVWEHRYYKSPAFFKIYIAFSYIDNLLASYKVKRIKSDKFDYVICDRWINDVIADIGSEFHRQNILELNWYRRFQKILPENTTQFVISRPDNLIIDAREDNRYDINFAERLNLYKKLEIIDTTIKVDNSGKIHDSVSYILERI